MTLTPRQREVLRRYVSGETHAQIARGIGCAPGTVKQHIHDIRDRLGAVGEPARKFMLVAMRVVSE